MNAEVDALVARIAVLESAIRWALGEEGEFPTEEPPPIAGKYRQRYYWRPELRRRAALAARPAAPVGEAEGDKAKHMRDSMPRFSQAEIKRLRAKE